MSSLPSDCLSILERQASPMQALPVPPLPGWSDGLYVFFLGMTRVQYTDT